MHLWEGCVDNDPYSYNYCQNQKKSFKWCIRNYDFHKMFSFKKLKAEAAATGLANRYFWSELIGLKTCSVRVSCIENAFEMRPVLNHNLHCTLSQTNRVWFILWPEQSHTSQYFIGRVRKCWGVTLQIILLHPIHSHRVLCNTVKSSKLSYCWPWSVLNKLHQKAFIKLHCEIHYECTNAMHSAHWSHFGNDCSCWGGEGLISMASSQHC